MSVSLVRECEMSLERGRALRRPIEVRAHAARTSTLKTAVDVIGALAILIVLGPALLLISLVLYLDNPGPIFFKQERTGLGGRVFGLYKFRTMHAGPEQPKFVQAVAGDPRITRVGRFLRRSSLDEIPQLINVLRGEMSLVGPRPHVVEMDRALAPSVHDFWDRYLVKPGLSGLAQIHGFRGPTPSVEHIRRRLTLDRYYVRRWSLWLDIRILLVTPFRVFHPNAI